MEWLTNLLNYFGLYTQSQMYAEQQETLKFVGIAVKNNEKIIESNSENFKVIEDNIKYIETIKQYLDFLGKYNVKLSKGDIFTHIEFLKTLDGYDLILENQEGLRKEIERLKSEIKDD